MEPPVPSDLPTGQLAFLGRLPGHGPENLRAFPEFVNRHRWTWRRVAHVRPLSPGRFPPMPQKSHFPFNRCFLHASIVGRAGGSRAQQGETPQLLYEAGMTNQVGPCGAGPADAYEVAVEYSDSPTRCPKLSPVAARPSIVARRGASTTALPIAAAEQVSAGRDRVPHLA